MPSSDVIEVTPELIEADLTTTGAIERRLHELADEAHALRGQYHPHEIADRQDYLDSKRARAQAKKDADRIKAEGRDMTAAVDRWSQGVKAAVRQLTDPLYDLHAEYGTHVSAYEAAVVGARREMLRERYEEYAPALALPAEGADSAPVPFDRLWDRYAKAEKWSNYGTNDVRAVQSMESVVEAIATGERNIDALVAEPDRADVKALYFRTLSLDAAMARAGELTQARAATAAMEAERAAWAAQSETAPEAGPEPAQGAVPYEPPRTLDVAPPAHSQACPQAPRPVSSRSVMSRREYEAEYEQVTGRPAPQPGPAMPEGSGASTWAFCGYCTPQQALELEEFCARVGIGRVRVFDARGRKYKLVPTKEA